MGTLPNVTVKPIKFLLSVNERIHIGIDKYISIKSNDIGYFVVFITDIIYDWIRFLYLDRCNHLQATSSICN